MNCFHASKPFGLVADELFVLQPFVHDDVGNAVQKRDIRARLELEEHLGELHHRHASRVGDDDLCAVAVCLDHPVRDDRMGLLGVGADDEDDLHALDLADGVGHCPGTEYGGQSGHRGGVSETGAVVDVVRADPRAHELLECVIFFIRAACRGKAADGVGAVLVPDRLELPGDIGEGLVPRDFFELDISL